MSVCLGERDSRGRRVRAAFPPSAVIFRKGAHQPGGTSLRALLDQIQKLRASVAVYRPSLASS